MRKPASPPSAAEPVRVTRIGADGDGVADGLYTPFTLPGELVSVRRAGSRGTLVDIIEPSADRITPACPHFGICGGCSLQHWRDDEYAQWKISLLVAALTRAGFGEPPVGPLARTGPHQRRRVDLALRRVQGGDVVVGLHRMGSGDVFDMAACTVMHPALFALVAPLRTLLRGLALLKRDGSALLNLLDTGPDLLLRTDAGPSAVDRTRLAEFARTHGLRRIAWADDRGPTEPVVTLGPSSVAFGAIDVSPPPGAFLQASRAGQRSITDAVVAGLPERLPAKSRIAELYAGCGTITFALAHHVRVAAFEGDADAYAALRKAASSTPETAGRIAVERRDLARQPLAAKELVRFAAVVLDPPFVGAAEQMREIAASAIPRVIYVSCNPAALARDVRVLHDAGYRLMRATPVDQFLWSARLESVCVFER